MNYGSAAWKRTRPRYPPTMLACTKLTERAVNYIINVTAVRRHQSDRGCALAGALRTRRAPSNNGALIDGD